MKTQRVTAKQRMTQARLSDFWTRKRAKAVTPSQKAIAEWDYLRAIVRNAPEVAEPRLWGWLTARMIRTQPDLIRLVEICREAGDDLPDGNLDLVLHDRASTTVGGDGG